MVCLKCSQRLLKVSGSLLNVLGLFGGKLVQVLIDRRWRLDTVADTVKTGHQLCREREIRVARGVRRTELQALSLRVGAGDRDANTG